MSDHRKQARAATLPSTQLSTIKTARHFPVPLTQGQQGHLIPPPLNRQDIHITCLQHNPVRDHPE